MQIISSYELDDFDMIIIYNCKLISGNDSYAPYGLHIWSV